MPSHELYGSIHVILFTRAVGLRHQLLTTVRYGQVGHIVSIESRFFDRFLRSWLCARKKPPPRHGRIHPDPSPRSPCSSPPRRTVLWLHCRLAGALRPLLASPGLSPLLLYLQEPAPNPRGFDLDEGEESGQRPCCRLKPDRTRPCVAPPLLLSAEENGLIPWCVGGLATRPKAVASRCCPVSCRPVAPAVGSPAAVSGADGRKGPSPCCVAPPHHQARSPAALRPGRMWPKAVASPATAVEPGQPEPLLVAALVQCHFPR
ncbi:uncharacterized protein LOC133927799 [Phragmites australis]|uniref:uncharacterized protein LOC133927799 n=1 Tax=Phragmites australis TaxID=29695 RepID=UPI002D78058F|nr:uncharacterized protein LOC133927799 [Phragmites australis]